MIWGCKRFIYACFDKQLYDVTIQVYWNQPRKFQNIVVYPARMCITVIFPCIGTIMNAQPWKFMLLQFLDE